MNIKFEKKKTTATSPSDIWKSDAESRREPVNAPKRRIANQEMQQSPVSRLSLHV